METSVNLKPPPTSPWHGEGSKQTFAFALSALVIAACGGDPSKKQQDLDKNPAADLDTGDPVANPCANPCGNPGDGDGDGDADEPPEPEGPAVTFELKNSWTDDLVFNLDAGLGLVVQVYSGKPPKAVAVEPWARFCTASCDTEGAEKCPVCKKPEKISKIREAEQRQVVEPDKSFELEWDGTVHAYEKVKRNCQCFKKVSVADETYTVRACGLRLSKKHKKGSKLQCVLLEDALTFPSEEPQRVVIDFGDPNAKPKKAKK
jgi:hypothetical protein